MAYQVETKIKAAARDFAERRRVRGLVEGMTLPAGRVEGLSAVATSGSYDDLTDKPTLGGLAGTATVTVPGGAGRLEHAETVSAVGVTSASIVLLSLAATTAEDENEAETIGLLSASAVPSTDALTIRLAFNEPHSGPIKMNWSAL